MNSHNSIIDNPNLNLANNIPLLRNNMVNPPELEKQTLPNCNRALISIMSLVLLSYTQNKCSNLFQKVISYYAFSGNISKRPIQLFNQIDILVSYKSI